MGSLDLISVKKLSHEIQVNQKGSQHYQLTKTPGSESEHLFIPKEPLLPPPPHNTQIPKAINYRG